MPELPEVETTRLSLEPLIGCTIDSVDIFFPTLRWAIPTDLNKLADYKITDISRRAKYLILHFTHIQNSTSQKKLIIHLGMSGSLQQRNIDSDNLKHDHVVFHFKGHDIKLNYHDPRRFGAILWYQEYAEKLFNHLAPEPLTNEFNAAYLYAKLQKSQRAIKASIMNQQYVVGVGNIYATESLFLSGIHPLTPSKKLSLAQVTTLIQHIKEILAKAIDLGGSSLRDYTDATGKTGYFQQTLLVYGRAGETCQVCNTTLENVKITGRASCFCPKCQPMSL